MALLFNALTDRVEFNTTQVAPTSLTMWAWVFATTLVANRRITGKGGNAGFFNWNVQSTTGVIAVSIDYSTTDAFSSSIASVLVTNVHTFLAITFDGSTAPKIYAGGLDTLVTEVSYNTNLNPVGSRVAELDPRFFVGNQASIDRPFPGAMSSFGWVNTPLSLEVIQSLQFRRRHLSGQLMYLELGYTGTSSQANWISTTNANTGTITGATITTHVPIPYRRPWVLSADSVFSTSGPVVISTGGYGLSGLSGITAPVEDLR